MEANTLNLPVLASGPDGFPHTNLTFDVERRISIKLWKWPWNPVRRSFW